MKKLLPLLLIALLLAGCHGAPDTPTTGTAAPADRQTTQAASGSAVELYKLQADNYYGLAAMGSRLLLMADDGSLTAMQSGKQTATLVTGTPLYANSGSLDADTQGAAYYLPEQRQVVVLNPQLQETDRVTLPEDTQGTPAISVHNQEVYYCVSGEVRALDLQTRISRPVRSHSGTEATLSGCYFDGTVLACQVDGRTLYIAAQTGQLLSDSQKLVNLVTHGQMYLAEYMDGNTTQWIFGTPEGTPQSLHKEGLVFGALAMGGAVDYEAGEAGLHLRFYDLGSGKCTAAVDIEGAADPVTVLAMDGAIWVLTSVDGHQALCRWDPAQSPVTEEDSYIGPFYTADAPDAQGLAACQSRADALNQQYGVRIQTWQEAVKTPGSYQLTAEYRPEVLDGALNAMEPVLKCFPAQFLQKTVEAGWIRICLVRSTGTDASFVQYWEQGDCYLAIACDGMEADSLIRGVAYAIDSHVLGNSRDFDDWDKLNPQGFRYDYNYELTAIRTDADTYLAGEQRAFADRLSMSFPHEDRSRLFAAAMAEENVELFAGEWMQKKLRVLCQGIREAYHLDEGSYPWEQYLTAE